LDAAQPTLADLSGLDAVGAAPTEALLATGAVRDLTPLMQTDGRFDRSDFYEQLWQGVWWRERMWFMPLAGSMNLLYYDKNAYREAGQPEPTIRWTWQEIVADMTAVSHGQSALNGQLAWGFLDVGPDALFSYAYNWGNMCEEATVLCDQPLTPEAIAATLDWYHSLAGQPGQMADLTVLSEAERAGVLSNWQSARRRAVIWVETPLRYELRVQMDPMGVVPFPGSDRFDGITPLGVQGAFITMESERPYAAWEWLKFLTYQTPSARFRFVPARPSVATASQFWSRLPHDLANAMRTAFPFSRPVLIE
jgi:ABC-type glycerol-3-phosphate transport system substrate-binding protein